MVDTQTVLSLLLRGVTLSEVHIHRFCEALAVTHANSRGLRRQLRPSAGVGLLGGGGEGATRERGTQMTGGYRGSRTRDPWPTRTAPS